MNVLLEVIHILICKNLATACRSQVLCETCMYYEFLRVAMMRECGAMSFTVCSNSHLTQQKIVMLLRTVIRVKTSLNPPKFSLLLYRESCRVTKHHTTSKCTNCMSFILK